MIVSADRNLPFGIFELEMDFITRDPLVAGMHAWVLDKKKSLGAILASQRELQSDLRTILDAMVEKHLEVHERNAQMSLSALKPADDIRDVIVWDVFNRKEVAKLHVLGKAHQRRRQQPGGECRRHRDRPELLKPMTTS